MTSAMHADEPEIDAVLVRRLLAAQFPHWSGLSIEPVASAGTDNAIFRLGDDMSVRMPRIRSAVASLEKEKRWLSTLAPELPLPIPVPLAAGAPAERYPWPWAVCVWVDGQAMDTASAAPRAADRAGSAVRLAGFLTALRDADATGGPPPGGHNGRRGEPLARRDAETREAIRALATTMDAAALLREWEAALDAPHWDSEPVWIHGDLLPGNLVAAEGVLCGVIDFGALGVGDPACDLMAAWALFSGPGRRTFREALNVDDASWMRGRGWALSQALIFIPYYLQSNPRGVRQARATIAELLGNPA